MGNVSVTNELSSRPERSAVEGPAVYSTSSQLNRKSVVIHQEQPDLPATSFGWNEPGEGSLWGM
jgi:hypothetical protein